MYFVCDRGCVRALMPIEARRERVLEALEIELQAVGLGAENQTHPLEEQDKPFWPRAKPAIFPAPLHGTFHCSLHLVVYVFLH